MAQLIVALDVDDSKSALRLVKRLSPLVSLFKVGSQLFTKEGPRAVKLIKDRGAEVFLDLKFYDIPHTAARAVRAAVGLRVSMLTLHISGGREMLRLAKQAAVEKARSLGITRPLLFGVTVLTSQQGKSTKNEVLELAALAKRAGLDGVVASVKEAPLIRKRWGRNLLIITPGIRPKGAFRNDQKRIATVKQAVQAGSDFLVVGRPILKAKDPLSVVRKILKSI